MAFSIQLRSPGQGTRKLKVEPRTTMREVRKKASAIFNHIETKLYSDEGSLEAPNPIDCHRLPHPDTPAQLHRSKCKFKLQSRPHPWH